MARFFIVLVYLVALIIWLAALWFAFFTSPIQFQVPRYWSFGDGWRRRVGEFGAGIALMVSSKPRVGLRHCPEHRRKQRVFLALSLGAKVSGLCSILVANRHLVGRDTHREAQILAQQTCQ